MSPKDPPVALPDTDDPYVLLEVRPGASADQIRRAYLRRVKVFKPDRYPAELRRVREAYDRLREQEAWFHAWQQASEVVRQAQERAARRGESEAGGAGEAEDAERSDEALEAEAPEPAERAGRFRQLRVARPHRRGGGFVRPRKGREQVAEIVERQAAGHENSILKASGV